MISVYGDRKVPFESISPSPDISISVARADRTPTALLEPRPRARGGGPSAPRWRVAAGRLAALFLLLCLGAFVMSPAWAYKAGEGADDTPGDIKAYADVAAYLADPDRRSYGVVQIGQYLFRRVELERFHDANTLTNNNLIKDYADVPAYLADSGRTNRLYAAFDGGVYNVVELEAYHNADLLTDDNLPRAVAVGFRTVAVGDYAKALSHSATAVGSGASASGNGSTALGTAKAYGGHSTALGATAEAYSERSTAVGKFSLAYGRHATSLGTGASSYGTRATAVGPSAAALGERTTALGSNAIAANRDAHEGRPWKLGELIACARRTELSISSFVRECEQFLVAPEKADVRLAQDNAAGEAFRQTIQGRLQGVLLGLSTSRATAVGNSARALRQFATAVGDASKATAEYSTALGSSAHAGGDRSTALGRWAHATGDLSTAVGAAASVSGEDSTAVGRSAQAHGDRSVALGSYSGAGAWVASTRYADVAAYLADEDRAGFGRRHAVVADRVYSIAELEAMRSSLSDASLPTALADVSAVIAPSGSYGSVQDYLNDPARTGHAQVFIGRNVYNVAELEAVQALTETSLPNPLKGAFGAVAVGVGAQAPAQRAVAVGLDAHAVGDNAIAIGSEVTAGANEVVIGSTDHAYKLPGLGASQTDNPEVLTVDATGQLMPDGGELHRRVTGLESRPTGSEVVDTALADLGTPTDTADQDGSAFGRIASVRQDLGTVSDALGTATDVAADDGSAFARIAKVGEDLGTAKAALETAAYTLLNLLKDQTLSGEQTLDSDGNPVGTSMDEFQGLDEAKGNAISSKERLAYLFQALYGKPYVEEGRADPTTDSDTPHENSIAGRIGSVERGESRNGGYEEAPEIGSGDGAPVSSSSRRVVVQDTNRDGSVRLRTLDFSDLSALDRRIDAFDKRVDSLDERLDRATAMSSALSALPNVVPNGGRFYLGAGVGHYADKQAFAIGMSARLGTKNNVFVNAGVATASGAKSVSARGGIGFVW